MGKKNIKNQLDRKNEEKSRSRAISTGTSRILGRESQLESFNKVGRESSSHSIDLSSSGKVISSSWNFLKSRSKNSSNTSSPATTKSSIVTKDGLDVDRLTEEFTVLDASSNNGDASPPKKLSRDLDDDYTTTAGEAKRQRPVSGRTLTSLFSAFSSSGVVNNNHVSTNSTTTSNSDNSKISNTRKAKPSINVNESHTRSKVGGFSSFPFYSSNSDNNKSSSDLTMIESYLYIGTLQASLDISRLKSFGISVVIDCTHISDAENHLGTIKSSSISHSNFIKTYRFDMHDRSSEDILANVYNVIEIIEKSRNSKTAVLIHCVKGISRSASLVIAYLMYHYGIDFKKAFNSVKSLRPNINPNPSFVFQLYSWEQGRPLALNSSNDKNSEIVVAYEIQIPKSTAEQENLPIIIGPIQNSSILNIFSNSSSSTLMNHNSSILSSNGRCCFVYFLLSQKFYIWLSKDGISDDLRNAMEHAAIQLSMYENLPDISTAINIYEGSEPLDFIELVNKSIVR